MNAAVRRFFRDLHSGPIRSHVETVAEALRLTAGEAGGGLVYRGPSRLDPGSTLILDAASGHWQTQPAGESGSLFELLAKLLRLSPLQAGLWLTSRGERNLALDLEPRPTGTEPPVDLAFDHPAMRARGLDPATCRDREIGLVTTPGDPHEGRLAVTVFDIAGEHAGRTYRRVDLQRERRPIRPRRATPKWSLDKGFPRGRHLYNLDRAWPSLATSNAAIIVEGPFDALHLHSQGWTNTVAILGNHLTGWHVDLLLTVGVSTVVLLLDNDHGGRLGRHWATSLDGRLDQFQVVDLGQALNPGRDPDELLPSELTHLLGAFRPDAILANRRLDSRTSSRSDQSVMS